MRLHPFNKPIKLLYFRLFDVSVLFAHFHFKVIRKLLYSNSSKDITCQSGKLKTDFTSLIAKSTNPGLWDTTFFAHCSGLIKDNIKIKNNNKNCSFFWARCCVLRGSHAGLPTPFSLTYFKMANAASPTDYSSLKHAIMMGCSTNHGLSNSTFVAPWDCK